MSWGYRFSIPEAARAEGSEDAIKFDGRVVTTGKVIPFLERLKGRPRWGLSRYGMNMHSGSKSRMFWNAKRESLKSNEQWARLLRMRLLLPIDAYVDSVPTRRWMAGERAWVPGLIDPSANGGIVTITESAEQGGVPILLTQEAGIAWLDASPWEVEALLDGERQKFEQADIFLSARLDTESKARPPITPLKAA